MLKQVNHREYDGALGVIVGLVSSQLGMEAEWNLREAAKEVVCGLDKRGESLDRKTIKKVLGEAQRWTSIKDGK